mmetsp:Transcript_35874/g.97219  ORF Transcript_35874/g.97219 Transcript_35874/m.97219 type:complete len:152 (-) Transcript_35874:174-629(-)
MAAENLLAAAKLVDSTGSVVDPASLKGQKVALYFAGNWCPMCRDFTPKLKERTDTEEKAAKIVFVSSDFTEEEFTQHRADMGSNWLAVAYGSEEQNALKRQFKLWGGKESGTFGTDRRGGIPALVVVDPETGAEKEFLDAEGKGAAILPSV